MDLKRFMAWAADRYAYPSLLDVLHATPTAELRPIVKSGESKAGSEDAEEEEHTQADEEEMGMSYEELGWFGRLRKIHRHGPVSMFRRLLHTWTELTPSSAVAEKVRT